MESGIRPFGLKSLLLAGLLGATLAMTGCSGDDGAPGAPADPTAVANLQSEVASLNADIAALQAELAVATDPAKIDQLTADLAATQAELAALKADSGVDEVIGADRVAVSPTAKTTLVIKDLAFGVDTDNKVTASFQVTDGTSPITGLTPTASNIYLAGLVKGAVGSGDADEWQYWTDVNDDTLEETSPGNYLLTTNKQVGDVPVNTVTTTQRGVVRIALSPFNTGVSTYDFDLAAPAIPVAAGKDVVSDASCKDCHGFGVTIHSYGRNDTKVCVVCHSPNYNYTMDNKPANMADREADMVTMIHQIHTNKADTLGALHWDGHGENWETLQYPGTILNCAKCHNGVAQADNWKTKPTMAACDSCHTTVKFDGAEYTGIKGTLKTHGGHTVVNNNNALCATCHNADSIAAKHKPAARDDAGQRLVEAVIPAGGVVVDVDGGVTVSFTVTENGAAKTDLGTSGTAFTLAKLVPSTAGTPSYWQSYLSQVRTKVTGTEGQAPVLQGRTEPATAGLLTNLGGGNYTYKFGLVNSEPAGNIKNITHAHNRNPDNSEYGPNQMEYAVAYEPTLTHRVAIALSGNKTNAFIDFVPAGNTAETRNIVSRDACNKCHGDSQLHSGFALEYCTGCHQQNSFDPFSGPAGDNTVLLSTDKAAFGSSSVELERLIHKIHMGKDLVNGFVVNGTHDYSNLQYPSGVPYDGRTPNASDCRVCHDESNVKMTEADAWQYGTRACGSCHDGYGTTQHIESFTNANGYATCTYCHAPGGIKPVEEAHYNKK